MPRLGASLPAVRPPATVDVCATRTGTVEVCLQNPCGYPEAGARRWRPWVAGLVAELAPQAGSLAIRFVSDREMRRLNRSYRRKDAPTDVLSFPGDLEAGAAAPAAGDRHLGDVAVSIPAARRQAREFGRGVEAEIRTLLLHGVLHCLGYDHETDDGTMERLEHSLRPRFVDHA